MNEVVSSLKLTWQLCYTSKRCSYILRMGEKDVTSSNKYFVAFDCKPLT